MISRVTLLHESGDRYELDYDDFNTFSIKETKSIRFVDDVEILSANEVDFIIKKSKNETVIATDWCGDPVKLPFFNRIAINDIEDIEVLYNDGTLNLFHVRWKDNDEHIFTNVYQHTEYDADGNIHVCIK